MPSPSPAPAPTLPSPSLRPASRRSSRDSCDSEASLNAEELLEEADALLPHGLPLAAYKVEQATAAVAPGMRLAAITGPPAGAAGGGARPGAAPTLVLSVVQRRSRRPVAPVDAGEAKEMERGGAVAAGAAPHKFVLDGRTLSPGGSSEERDPLTYRVECLRVFLDAVLGEEPFLRLYRRIVDARADGGAGGADVSLTRTVRDALGRRHKALTPLVYQLLFCEEAAFAS